MLLQSFKFLSVDIKLSSLSVIIIVYIFLNVSYQWLKIYLLWRKYLSLNAGQFCACQVKSFQTGICIYIYIVSRVLLN